MQRRTALRALMWAGHACAARSVFGDPTTISPATRDAEARRLSWPSFRGPDGSGVSVHAGAPLAWDGATGQGVLWKADVPLPGANSPIVYQDRVFVSGATAQQREVYCFHADRGELLWRAKVGPKSVGEPPKVTAATGYAASTLTTDGKAVYAIFASGDLAAIDFSGKEIWRRALGPFANHYGYAASLANWRRRVIVQLDQGGAKDGRSKLLAFDGATGAVAWTVDRPTPVSWCSPIVVEHAREPVVLTGGDPWVIAYSADSGAELWRADCLAPAEVAATPVYSESVVFAANDYAALSAIAADGRGDVTKSHVRWSAEVGLPDTCSPLVTDQFVLLMNSAGVLTCYDKHRGGDPLWEEDFQSEFDASPSLAGGRVYLFDRHGSAWVVAPTRTACPRVARCELSEERLSSPAFQAGRIYIRGNKRLFCLGR